MFLIEAAIHNLDEVCELIEHKKASTGIEAASRCQVWAMRTLQIIRQASMMGRICSGTLIDALLCLVLSLPA